MFEVALKKVDACVTLIDRLKRGGSAPLNLFCPDVVRFLRTTGTVEVRMPRLRLIERGGDDHTLIELDRVTQTKCTVSACRLIELLTIVSGAKMLKTVLKMSLFEDLDVPGPVPRMEGCCIPTVSLSIDLLLEPLEPF